MGLSGFLRVLTNKFQSYMENPYPVFIFLSGFYKLSTTPAYKVIPLLKNSTFCILIIYILKSSTYILNIKKKTLALFYRMKIYLYLFYYLIYIVFVLIIKETENEKTKSTILYLHFISF